MKSLRHFGPLVFLVFCASPAPAQQNAPFQLIPKQPIGVAPKPSANAPDLEIGSVVRRANSALNNIITLIADFSQTNSLGQRATGKLYLLRPGRLRFEYAAPSPIEVVADGTSLAVRNKKLNTQEVYFIRQTPLKFLLKANINLTQDVLITGVTSDTEHTILKIEDKTTFGGSSKIELYFKSSDFLLSQWVIVDPQGSETRVQLSNIDQSKRPDRSLFVINYERFDNQ
jgi:outer membrane lipoprotein-sorting protein